MANDRHVSSVCGASVSSMETISFAPMARQSPISRNLGPSDRASRIANRGVNGVGAIALCEIGDGPVNRPLPTSPSVSPQQASESTEPMARFTRSTLSLLRSGIALRQASAVLAAFLHIEVRTFGDCNWPRMGIPNANS